jgi:hypothetical protein
MRHSNIAWVAVVLVAIAGCHKSEPQVAVAPAPRLAPADTDTADRVRLLYTLLDAPFGRIRFDSSVPQRCVIEIRLGKQVVYSDHFQTSKNDPVFKSPLVLGLRPVDNGELSKARRMRYAIQCGSYSTSHLVRNPFLGMVTAGTLSDIQSVDGKPVVVMSFKSAGPNPGGGAVVQVTFDSKGLSESTPGAVDHVDSSWAKARF